MATDFSSQARNALQWARALAGALGAKLVLLHVIDIFSMAEVGSVMAGTDPLHLLREQAQNCMRELRSIVPDAEVVVHEGSPRPAIVDAALDFGGVFAATPF